MSYAANFLKTLKAGKKIRKTVTWPGTEQAFEFKLLSEQDKHDALIQASMLFKDVVITHHNIRGFESEIETQMLYRVCVECGSDTPVAANVTEFRTLITGTEKDWLVEEYNNFAQEYNPSVTSLSNEEFDKLMFDLKKKPEMTIGSVSNLRIAKKLILSLVSQVAALQKVSGSIST